MTTPELPWWRGAARGRLAADVLQAVRPWCAVTDSPELRDFDRRSRAKVAFLFACFGVTFAVYEWAPRSPITDVGAALVLGLFVVPYIRVFMHSQMHWGLGGARATRFLLDHFISLFFATPQTGYAVGHRMHHRYDNDWSANGTPFDLQSTYMFTRSSRPCRMFVWIPYYAFAFQMMVVPWLVFTKGLARERFWYVVEALVIVAFHELLYRLDRSFYLFAYLPALVFAWCASATVLYMMHAVDARDYAIHPTNTCTSGFFNSFGDNDGYHLEHTLFPAIHPLHLPRVHRLLKCDPRQILRNHYFIAGVKYALAKPPVDDAETTALRRGAA